MSAIHGSWGEAEQERLRPPIQPREAWADGIPTPRGLAPEKDVRFLLVHHTQTPNGERGRKVRKRLRQIHAYHRSEKGWADIAYNFLVDEEGTIWEGRAGSLAGPVRGDATGGSQGFAVLCCFLGDHSTLAPSAPARDAMVRLLAWQAVVNGIDLSPDQQVTFTSRGSNRFRKGATVRTTPIAGHRDMSQTQCPGDAAYALVSDHLRPAAHALVTESSPVPASMAADSSSPGGPTGPPVGTTSVQDGRAPTSPASPQVGRAEVDELGPWPLGAGIAGAVVTGGLAWVFARRLRNSSMPAGPVQDS